MACLRFHQARSSLIQGQAGQAGAPGALCITVAMRGECSSAVLLCTYMLSVPLLVATERIRYQSVPTTDPWRCVVVVAGKIYATSGRTIVIYDPVANTFIQKSDVIPRDTATRNCAVIAGKIYGVPRDRGEVKVLTYNPATDTVRSTAVDHDDGCCKWSGGVEICGKLYGVPSSQNHVLIFDPVSDAVSKSAQIPTQMDGGGQQWSAGIAIEGKLYCLPSKGDNVLIYDTVDDSFSSSGTVPSRSTCARPCEDWKWWSGPGLTFDGKLLGLPRTADSVLMYDLATNTFTCSGKIPSSDRWKWAGWTKGVWIGNKIYMAPTNADTVLIYDPVHKTFARSRGTIRVPAYTAGELDKYGSSVAVDGVLYGLSIKATKMLIYDPEVTTTAGPIPLPACAARPTAFPTTAKPTEYPTAKPKDYPTAKPSPVPTSKSPTRAPTGHPSLSPSKAPSTKPTPSPSGSPSGSPTVQPSGSPTPEPSVSPSQAPSAPPSAPHLPTSATSPTRFPTHFPTSATPTGAAQGCDPGKCIDRCKAKFGKELKGATYYCAKGCASVAGGEIKDLEALCDKYEHEERHECVGLSAALARGSPGAGLVCGALVKSGGPGAGPARGFPQLGALPTVFTGDAGPLVLLASATRGARRPRPASRAAGRAWSEARAGARWPCAAHEGWRLRNWLNVVT